MAYHYHLAQHHWNSSMLSKAITLPEWGGLLLITARYTCIATWIRISILMVIKWLLNVLCVIERSFNWFT